MSNTVECLACGHTDDVGSGPAFENSVFTCSECSARMAYGVLLPNVVIEPLVDARGNRLIRHRVQDVVTKKDLYVLDVDPLFAAMMAKATLSLVIP